MPLLVPPLLKSSRAERIRTSDLLTPSQHSLALGVRWDCKHGVFAVNNSLEPVFEVQVTNVGATFSATPPNRAFEPF